MSDKPVTQDQLAQQLTTAQEHIIQAIARMITDSETRMREHQRQEAERLETKILAAFHKFAERHDARWSVARILGSDAQTRVEELRDEIRARLAELERRLPPQ